MTSPHAQTAVILSGGGARAAYQIGALRAVARILGPHARSPFGVITGTSAGAINAAALAANADNWRRGIARALRLWRNIVVSDVYEAELASVAGYGMRWLASVLVGGGGPAQAASMLDNAPLRGLLERALDMAAVPSRIQAGQLHAFAINATSYTTGHAVSFFDGAPSLAPWRRTRRRGEKALITVDHLLGSTAIPFIFPAVRIAEDYYADGSMRQIAPLSPPDFDPSKLEINGAPYQKTGDKWSGPSGQMDSGSIQSVIDKGSKFTLRIPMKSAFAGDSGGTHTHPALEPPPAE
jgi:NTE family protein